MKNRAYSAFVVLGFLAVSLLCLPGRAGPANDDFSNSDQTAGTNITYTGNFDDATSESGEPITGATNTVWMSWAAPNTGVAQYVMASAPQFQFVAVYTGPDVTDLQPVRAVSIVNDNYRFLTTAGTVYHFQFSGGADTFTFYLSFQTMGACLNDDFTNAQVVKGKVINFNPATVDGATMELGEPLHMGNIPQKSIWWEWQAPQHGTFSINPSDSVATNLVLAAYTGNSVEALTLVAKSTNATLYIPELGGQTFYIAGAVNTNETGDIMNYAQYSGVDYSSHVIPGNLLLEPSWEGTELNPQHWGKSGSIGGAVNENTGGADGSTWPSLGHLAAIWQDFTTIPGHNYAVTFAYEVGGLPTSGSTTAQVGAYWNSSQLGISVVPLGEAGFWHYSTYTVLATNTTASVAFTNLGNAVELDNFSVVDLSAPPAIVTQPASISSVGGGTASFIVGATGTSPLNFQWLQNGTPLAGQTNNLLALSAVTTNQAGNYQVIITNAFGSVTSSVATLRVNSPSSATILVQPYGDSIPAGGYFNFNVAAAGTPPLSYQWFFNSQTVTGATNANLSLTNAQPDEAGVYTVEVQNSASAVFSLPATLDIATNLPGGGEINFRNQNISGLTNASAPIFDIDGLTPLNGGTYVAQLYAGPSLDLLRPAGSPSPFQSGFKAGYFASQLVTLGNVPPGSNAVLQVMAWDASYGASYEVARAAGGEFGTSSVLQLAVGGGMLPPQSLQGLQSFSLQSGLPYFEAGTIHFVNLLPPNQAVWALHGQAGSIYLIEKAATNLVWNPFLIITNVTGTVDFTDTTSGRGGTFYRARILD